MARYRSAVDASDTRSRDSCGILLIALASLGSATASEAFFSSFIASRRDESCGVTLLSRSAADCSRDDAALSNFAKFLSRRRSQTSAALELVKAPSLRSFELFALRSA